MLRDTQPRLIPDQTMDEQRRARLASFITVVHEQAAVAAVIFPRYGSNHALIEASGQLQQDDDSFAARVLRATVDLLDTDIDLDAIPDAATADDMSRRIHQADREGTLGERGRLLRLAEFAGRVADWQTGQPHEVRGA